MISMRVMPAMAVTMPTSSFSSSQHRPLLDMQLEKGLDVGRVCWRQPRRIAADLDDALPQRQFARASRLEPLRRAAARPCRGCRCRRRRRSRLPRRGNRRSRDRDRARCRRRASARATSSAAATPAMPSNRPPSGTVSECEPSMIVPSPASGPCARPIRLPAASIRVSRPAALKRCSSQLAALEEQRREGAPRIGTVRLGDRGQRHR